MSTVALRARRVALVRLALVVALGQRGEIARDRAPDAVEPDRVAPVHARDAVRLPAERPSVSIDRSSWAIGLSRPPEVLRAQLLLGHLLALRLAAAVEHLRELLPLARRADVDAHLHGERDRRAEGVELRVGVAEPRVDLVLERAAPVVLSKPRTYMSVGSTKVCCPQPCSLPCRAAAGPPRRAGWRRRS
jgi:hypothetical protein